MASTEKNEAEIDNKIKYDYYQIVEKSNGFSCKVKETFTRLYSISFNEVQDDTINLIKLRSGFYYLGQEEEDQIQGTFVTNCERLGGYDKERSINSTRKWYTHVSVAGEKETRALEGKVREYNGSSNYAQYVQAVGEIIDKEELTIWRTESYENTDPDSVAKSCLSQQIENYMALENLVNQQDDKLKHHLNDIKLVKITVFNNIKSDGSETGKLSKDYYIAPTKNFINRRSNNKQLTLTVVAEADGNCLMASQEELISVLSGEK